MIRKIERRWFEIWGAEEAQNRFLKYLLLIFCAVSMIELCAITVLSLRKPILIGVGKEQTKWNIAEEPSPETLTREINRIIIRYLKTRHSWEWQNIEAKSKESAGLVAPEFKDKFTVSYQEQIRLAKEKQVSQKIYPEEPQVDLKNKTASVVTERILIVNGLRASQPLNFEIGFEFGERSEANPEGIYITSEKVLNQN